MKAPLRVEQGIFKAAGTFDDSILTFHAHLVHLKSSSKQKRKSSQDSQQRQRRGGEKPAVQRSRSAVHSSYHP